MNHGQEYKAIVSKYFRHCANADVLEIGPNMGEHTAMITEYKPKIVTLVEANPECEIYLKLHFGNYNPHFKGQLAKNYNVIIDDVHNYLKDEHKHDVVVCCGVLYHLSSPVHLLELIANSANPEIVILETWHSGFLGNPKWNDSKAYIGEQLTNIPGYYYTCNKKSSKVHVRFSKEFIIKVMSNLGYDLIEEEVYKKDQDNCTMTVFKRNDG